MKSLSVFVLAVALVSIGATLADQPPTQIPTRDGSAFPAKRSVADAPAQNQSPIESAAKSTAQSQMQAKIQEAINGKSVETGDGILDDMLKVLQQRGSILDGSSLDIDDPAASAGQLQVDGSGTAAAAKAARTTPVKARVAESLLKSARLMEKLGKLDAEQSKLVLQLRQQSLRLLTEAVAAPTTK